MSTPANGSDPAGSLPTNEVRVVLDQRSIWRAGWLIVAIVAIAALGRWILADGGSVIFTLIMSFLASVAIEPAVSRLAQHMKRGVATFLTLITVIVVTVVLIAIFGRLLADQIGQLVRALPGLVDRATAYSNKHWGTSLEPKQVLDYLDLSPGQIQTIASNVAGGLLGIVLAAMILALFDIYPCRYELLPQLAEPAAPPPELPSPPRGERPSAVKGWLATTFRSG